ncbi:class I SAM-dependent methyltransferase [Cohnella hongkongensis]|uniref:Class I SAM-dependent methyltransferase n=1 Tax=Cohnella hongkongensis TaxID=178337 RepID=A0ABV9F8E4_9BACL
MDKARQVRLFDRQAAKYGRRRENATMQSWRSELLSGARGQVLELAVGAGANFRYYPAGVRVIATDFSPRMLTLAREAAKACRMEAEFLLSDIERLEFPDHSFDTIVSTLSFCSYEDPIGVLRKLRRWCKPDGALLFLEHGISRHAIVAAAQRLLNPLLYRTIGCHHTRDIPAMIAEAGIRIESKESHMLKMVHLLRATPGS